MATPFRPFVTVQDGNLRGILDNGRMVMHGGDGVPVLYADGMLVGVSNPFFMMEHNEPWPNILSLVSRDHEPGGVPECLDGAPLAETGRPAGGAPACLPPGRATALRLASLFHSDKVGRGHPGACPYVPARGSFSAPRGSASCTGTTRSSRLSWRTGQRTRTPSIASCGGTLRS